jgi:hypothetical protein
MQAPRGSIWTTAGVFIFVGGYVGGLIVAIGSAMSGFGGLSDSVWSRIVSVPLTALMGLVFGFAPAAGTGLIAGLLSSVVRQRVAWVVLASAIGTVLSGLFLAHDLDGWVLFGSIGALSAFVSALIALQVRPRWSN